MIQKFTVESLATIDDGKVKHALEQAVGRALADCADRAGTKEPRKVTLTISLVPVPDEANELDSCTVEFSFAESMPKRRTKTFDMRASGDSLLFNELSPEEIRQGTLDEVPEPNPAHAPRKVS